MFGIADAIGVAAICVVLFPVVFALARRIAPKAEKRPADGTDRVEELERRVGELETGQQRMAELEERVDFAERLLAKQRDTERLGPPRP
jgi:uncharacterized membrane protein